MQIRVLHSYVAEASAVISGWLQGGERGRVGLSLRQLQLWCVPGVCLPMPMAETFSPPGTVVTAMESNDELCSPLGLATAAAPPSPWQGSPGRGMPPPPHGRARGTFSIKLCWPKALLQAGAPQEHALVAALSAPSSERDAAAAALSRPASSSTLDTLGDAIAAAPLPSPAPPLIPSKLTRSDVEVLATVKIHRAWAGLIVDDSILVDLVRERASVAAAGLSRGLPPLYAVEFSFRPAMLGSSFFPSPAAVPQPRLPLRRGGDASPHPGPLPYVMGLETPPWVRMLAEMQALEVHGDIPMLSRHFGALLHNWWSSAVSESSATTKPSGDDGGLAEEGDAAFDFEDGDGSAVRAEKANAGEGSAPVKLSFSDDVEESVNSGPAAGVVQGASLLSADLPTPVLHASVTPGSVSDDSAVPLQHTASVPVIGKVATSCVDDDDPRMDVPDIRRHSVSDAIDLFKQSSLDDRDVRKQSFVDEPDARRQSMFEAHDVRRQSVASSSTLSRGGMQLRTDRSVSMSSGGQRANPRSLRADLALRETRAQHAAAARNAASFEVSRRVRHYLQSEDLRLEVNLHLSVMSIPGMPVLLVPEESRYHDRPVEGSEGDPPPAHPVIMDISGIGVSASAAPTPESSSDALKRGQRLRPSSSRQVLVLQIASFVRPRPSLIPPPGSGLVTVNAASGSPRGATREPAGATKSHGVVQGPTSIPEVARPPPAPVELAEAAASAPICQPTRLDTGTGSASSDVTRATAAEAELTPRQKTQHDLPSQSVMKMHPLSGGLAAASAPVVSVNAPVPTDSRASGVAMKPAIPAKPPPSVPGPAMSGVSNFLSSFLQPPAATTAQSPRKHAVVQAAVAPKSAPTAEQRIIVQAAGIGEPSRPMTLLAESAAPSTSSSVIPTTQPPPGAMIASDSGSASNRAAAELHAASATRVAHVPISAPVPPPNRAQTVASTTTAVPTSPSLPAAALCIDFQFSLLGLLEDVTAVSTAIDVVAQLQQATTSNAV